MSHSSSKFHVELERASKTVIDGNNKLVKHAGATVLYIKRSVSIKLDCLLNEAKTISQKAYQFRQQKATCVRSLSMALVVNLGKCLLGIDDKDYRYEDEGSSEEVIEEDRWELMLGLHVYGLDLGSS
ncbi:hypothetical protein BGZ74_003551 [Mortierella antarctica]|nr:hypothetical protein BGZ74_003551 [Mortierella antarctica]